MSSASLPQSASAPVAPVCPLPAAVTLEAINASVRIPVLMMVAASSFWLLLSMVASLLTSVKLHAPGMLAGSAWLGYGRLQAAGWEMGLHGFLSQASLAVVLWMTCRMGWARLEQPAFALLGIALWNVAVLAGTFSILAGNNSGHEWLQMPKGAVAVLLGATVCLGISALSSFHARRERVLHPSQWFLLLALLALPWFLSTAFFLLQVSPVRGVMQAAVDFWYVQGFSVLWLGSVGVAVFFYLWPRHANRPLASRQLALFSFWSLAIFAGWGGIPQGVPLPAWMVSLGTVIAVILAVPVVAVAWNIKLTACGAGRVVGPELTAASFLRFSTVAYVLAGLLAALVSLPVVSDAVQFTLATTGLIHLGLFGFAGMALFAAIYHMLAALGGPLECARLRKIHYGCAAGGTIVIVVALLVGGVVQGSMMNRLNEPFLKSVRATIPFVGITTLGVLLLLAGQAAFLLNFAGSIRRQCLACFAGKKEGR